MKNQAKPTLNEHSDDSVSMRKYILFPRDQAAYFYGRLLMLEDQQRERPSYSTSKEDELDRYDVQVLQIIADIDSQFSSRPTAASAVSRYLLKSSNETVQRVGRHLQDRLKRQAAELQGDF